MTTCIHGVTSHFQEQFNYTASLRNTIPVNSQSPLSVLLFPTSCLHPFSSVLDAKDLECLTLNSQLFFLLISCISLSYFVSIFMLSSTSTKRKKWQRQHTKRGNTFDCLSVTALKRKKKSPPGQEMGYDSLNSLTRSSFWLLCVIPSPTKKYISTTSIHCKNKKFD